MKKTLLILSCLAAAASAYVDTDLDGVEDSMDRCPDTQLSELVGSDGCPVASLISPHRFDIIAGVSYNGGSRLDIAQEGEDTVALSLQADYYYKQYTVQLATSFYNTDSDSGLNDTLLAAYYRFQPTEKLFGRIGVGVVLPTYETGFDNEAADYQASAALSYSIGERLNVFGGFSYTLVNDDDVYNVTDIGDVIYQDTAAWMAGAGYRFSPNFYASLSYGSSDSIYRDVEAIENVSLYGVYNVSDSLFLTFSYASGLSDSASDNAVALRIGRYF